MKRETRGIPTGGQFAVDARAEADVELGPTYTSDMHAVGFNDDQVECDRCGRTELRGTVVIADGDGNIAYRMGSTCAGTFLSAKITKAQAVNMESSRRMAVGDGLRRAMMNIDRGQFSAASADLDDVTARGLHLPEEHERYAAFREQIETGRSKLTHRYAVSVDGREPTEVDGLRDARTVVDGYTRLPVTVMELTDDGWVPFTGELPADARRR